VLELGEGGDGHDALLGEGFIDARMLRRTAAPVLEEYDIAPEVGR